MSTAILKDVGELSHALAKGKEGTGAVFVQLFQLNQAEKIFKGHVFSGMDNPFLKKAVELLKIDPRHLNLPTDQGIIAEEVLTTKELVVTNSLYDAVGHSWNEGVCRSIQALLGIQTVAMVPLCSDDEVLGLLNFAFKKQKIDYYMVNAFAGYILMIMEKSKLEHRLRESECGIGRDLGLQDPINTIFDSIDETIYVSDPETYELLFFNRKAGEGAELVKGQKCHQTIYGLGAPCPFCTNDRIFGKNQYSPYIWEYRNKVNNHRYCCIDRVIPWIDGRKVRYEMTIDITNRARLDEDKTQ